VFDPVIALVTNHFGKGVVVVGGVGALIAPGDLRTKAIGFCYRGCCKWACNACCKSRIWYIELVFSVNV